MSRSRTVTLHVPAPSPIAETIVARGGSLGWIRSAEVLGPPEAQLRIRHVARRHGVRVHARAPRAESDAIVIRGAEQQIEIGRCDDAIVWRPEAAPSPAMAPLDLRGLTVDSVAGPEMLVAAAEVSRALAGRAPNRGSVKLASRPTPGGTVVFVGVGVLAQSTLVALDAAQPRNLEVVLIDPDQARARNRPQLLLERADVGRRKVFAVAMKLAGFASVTAVPEPFAATQLNRLQGSNAVVVAATDGFDSRIAVERECRRRGLPVVFGGLAEGGGGRARVLGPGTPCLECGPERARASIRDRGCAHRPPEHALAADFVGAMVAMLVLRILASDGDPTETRELDPLQPGIGAIMSTLKVVGSCATQCRFAEGAS